MEGKKQIGFSEEKMTDRKQKVYKRLDDLNIPYTVTDHPAVYTIEDMEKLQIPEMDWVPKNLFIRDDKKNRYFITVLQKDKRVDLKALRGLLPSRPLTFASEEALKELLGLSKGEVTPFGALNDEACRVEVVIDRDLLEFQRIGVHPNDNTATVWISPAHLEEVLRKSGHSVTYVDFFCK